MLDNKNNHNGSEPKLSGNALFDILNRACTDAHELYRSAAPNDCVPVMTGCRRDGAVVIMPLAPVVDDQPDPAAVETARSVVQANDCDYVLMFYPVHVCPGDENDDSDPAFGVIVEIQPKGLPALKRLILIDRNAHDNDEVLPKLPIIGHAFGVFYPHLLAGEHAA